MVSIRHKELEHKVEKLKHMKLEVMLPKIKNKINPNVNKPYWISPYEVLQSWLITNTVYLLIWLWKIRGQGGLKDTWIPGSVITSATVDVQWHSTGDDQQRSECSHRPACWSIL